MKILVLRFSSIGDIVLTTPVIRCLRKKFPEAHISFVTKEVFREVLSANPYINKLHTFTKEVDEIVPTLKGEKFDVIIDLHKNIRSRRLKRALKTKSYTFPKLNIRKWLLVNLGAPRLPNTHIVDRYFKAVQPLGVMNDEQGLDYFIPLNTKPAAELLPSTHHGNYIVLVLGAAHATKSIPENKLAYIAANIQYPLVLIGGKKEEVTGNSLAVIGPHIFNAAGKFSLSESAQVIKNARLVITPDTGMMHIAAAFKKPIISVWGNTIPEFGMYPYKTEASIVFENKNLRCRPCSKIGYDKCPKGHFRCMMEIDYDALLSVVKQRF